jgi:hypothetical protein
MRLRGGRTRFGGKARRGKKQIVLVEVVQSPINADWLVAADYPVRTLPALMAQKKVCLVSEVTAQYKVKFVGQTHFSLLTTTKRHDARAR